MGQKVNPHGFRVGVIKDWDSRWYAREDQVGDLIVEDDKIRKFLKKTLYSAGIPRIEIERSNDRVQVFLHCARPGMIVGTDKSKSQVESLEASLRKLTGKTVKLSIVEVRRGEIDMTAQLVAENVAQQIENRTAFRRAMKNAVSRAMRAGAKGIKIMASGRLAGAEIARVEQYHEGTIPLQTLRADIDYGFAEAGTTYGRIGIKVWIYKGEVLSQTLRTTPRTLDLSKPYRERSDRPRRGGNRDRRDGDRRPYNRDGGNGGGGNYNRNGSGNGGGYNRNNSYNRAGSGENRDGNGGYNRGGSYNRNSSGGNRDNRTNNNGSSGSGYNRSPAKPQEGGNR